MTPKQTFYAISFAGSGLAIWLYVVTQVPADLHNWKILVVFFMSLLMWMSSLLSFIIFRVRVRQTNGEVIYAHLKPAIRQGSLIAATITILLLLQALRVISWWEMLLVVIGAILFEIALSQPKQTGKLK